MSDPSGDFLFGSGGNYADFGTMGTFHGGFITTPPSVSQQTDMSTGELKTWGNGDPMKQLIVTLQTEERDPAKEGDTGLRTMYVKGSMKAESESMTAAIAGAVKAAGGEKLEVGGWLGVQYYADGEVTTRGFTAPKKYRAQYKVPDNSGAFLGTAAPVAPVQQALPAVMAPPATTTTDPWTGAPVAPAPAAAPATWPAVPGALPAAQQAPVGLDQVNVAAAALGAPQLPVMPAVAVSPVDQVRSMITAGQPVPAIMGTLQISPADMATCLLTIGYDVPTVAAQLGLPGTTIQLIANTLPGQQ